MQTMNDELYEGAIEAIERYFNDESVSLDETRAGLQALQDEIYIMMDAINISKQVD